MSASQDGSFPCAECGYALRGLTVDGTCPECGHAVLESLYDDPRLRRTCGFAIASLVLGILGLAGCIIFGFTGVTLGPLAIVFAYITRRRLKAKRVGGNSKGMAIAGLVLGVTGTLGGGYMLSTFLTGISQALSNAQQYQAPAPPPVPSPAMVPGASPAPSGSPVGAP